MQSEMTEEPEGASELSGHESAIPLKQNSVEMQSLQRALTNLYPGKQKQALLELEPEGEVKFSGHEIIRSLFPPGQYRPPGQMEQGLVPELEPLPKYPGAHKHWFWEVDPKGLRVFLGQTYVSPKPHQKLTGHWEQVLLSGMYPGLHIHSQA